MQATLFDEGGGIVTGTHDTDTARRALREQQAEAMGLFVAEAAGDAELGDAAQWLDAEPKMGWGRWTRQPGETGSVYWEEMFVGSRQPGIVKALWWSAAR